MSEPLSSPDLSTTKRALLEVRRLRARVAELERSGPEPVAIIGLGLRFPGPASDDASFWELLRNGVDAVTEVPPDRWDANAFYDPEPDAPGKMCARRMGFLRDVDQFDAAFFGISQREAESIDPQHRLLLEVAWEALENAAIPPSKLSGSQTGLFVGISNSDSMRAAFSDVAHLNAYASSGNAYSMAAGRLTYFLGLHGPALVIDTACSSSLVAVHQACQSLHSGECQMALAGGVNLILSPEVAISLSKARMLSPDGRCKTFDAAADGFVRGEGCGIVVLKPLAAALADGDPIRAVIRGSAVNQDGRSNGITAPNGAAQEALIRQAFSSAGVETDAVQYVEAHGTGTALGDPIEVHALAAVLGPGRAAENPLFIGSVKANIGHLEAAAGVAGLIKTVLALEHGEIPPQVHFHTLNPAIALEGAPLVVPVAPLPWPTTPRRIAGVSSFGFSGANAHVVLEGATASAGHPTEREVPAHIFTVSARTPEALASLAARYRNWLEEHPGPSLPDVCHSANAGRSHFAHRGALLASSTAELREKLARHHALSSPAYERPRVAFLFSGQGSAETAQGIYQSQPVFREAWRQCVDAPPADAPHAQTALFAFQYSLAQLWRSWGVEPEFVLGHGPGEAVAACVAGAFSPEDGMRLVAARARLWQSLPDGASVTEVSAGEAILAGLILELGLDTSVSIAAVNGPDLVVISGTASAIQAVIVRCATRGIPTRRLDASQAFPAPLAEPMLEVFRRHAAAVQYREPRLRLIASETGRAGAGAEMCEPEYWVRHLRRPVQFWGALNTAWEAGARVFLDIGPDATLAALGQDAMSANGGLWLAANQPLESLAKLYEAGVDVDWEAFDRPYGGIRIPLPSYPFERQLCRPERTPLRSVVQPAWPTVSAAARFEATRCPLDLDWANYPARWASLDRFTVEAMTAALSEMGVFRAPRERHTLDSMVAVTGIASAYRKLMQRWLDRLSDEAILLRDSEGGFRPVTALAVGPVRPFSAAQRELFAKETGLLDYVESCGLQLAAILRGQASSLEPLFAGGSTDRAESIYEHSPLARYCNAIVRAAVQAFVAARPGHLRILELGAGTGATAASVVPALPPGRAVYCYTDVSEAFLARGRQRFGADHNVEFGILDLERPLAEQNFEEHSFDMILAANVVHATRDVDASLARIHSLLSPGGFLVLSELTRARSWFEISSGLIEGWQRWEDRRRADGPLLTKDQWIEVLTESGFPQVLAVPDSAALEETLGQHVILAGLAEKGVVVRAAMDATVRTASVPTQPSAVEDSGLATRLQLASPQDRRALLADFVAVSLAKVLRMDASRLDRRQRLMDLGVDSLMAIEFRDLLNRGLDPGAPLPATLVFDYPTIQALADYLDSRLGGVEGAPPEKADVLEAAAEALAGLSEAEAEALLSSSLKSIYETHR